MRVSYSKIGAFSFCPKKYDFRYVQQRPAPAKPELAFGVALHSALEANFQQKVETRRDLSLKALRVHFVEELRHRLAPVSDEQLRGATDTRYLESMGEDLLERFLRERAPTLQPVPQGVEKSFRLALPGGHEISGQIDLIDDQDVVHDFKTSARPYDPQKADRTQLVIYAWAFEKLFHRRPRALCFDVFIKGDGAEGFVGLQDPVLFDPPTPEDMSGVARGLESQIEVLRSVTARGAFPRSFFPWRCHWCEYQTPCREEWEALGQPEPYRLRLPKL